MFEGLLQPTHLLLILIIALVVFGPGKLPELGSGLGKALRDFKKSMNEDPTPAPHETTPPPASQAAQPQQAVPQQEPAARVATPSDTTPHQS